MTFAATLRRWRIYMYTMRHRHKRPSLLAQMIDLFLMELTNWRWSWRTLVLTSTITPMLGIVALGVFAHNAGRETQAYILTGNVVLSLMFGNLEKVQSRFVYMRFTGPWITSLRCPFSVIR